MKVLFIGGTSFVGLKIVRALVRRNHQVTIVTRGNQKPSLPRDGVRHIKGDRNQIETLKAASGEYDVVIDNICYQPRELLGMLSAVDTKHYILTSTIGVEFPFRPAAHCAGYHDAVDGTQLVFEASNYALNKYACERLLMLQAAVPWTIFRWGVVYGVGESPDGLDVRCGEYVRRLLQDELVARHFFLSDRKVSFVYADDIEDAYLSAIASAQRQCIFNLTQDELVSEREYVKEHMKHLPPFPDFSRRGLDFSAALLPYHYQFDFVAENTLAKEELNWRPTPWAEAVKRCCPVLEARARKQIQNEKGT